MRSSSFWHRSAFKVTWLGLAEAFGIVAFGAAFAIAIYTVFNLMNQPHYRFGHVDAVYDEEIKTLYVEVEYSYLGGCKEIQWISEAVSESGERRRLETYRGTPRFTQKGHHTYGSIVALEDPLSSGNYEWRGTMTCTDANGELSTYVTGPNGVHALKSRGRDVYSVPWEWRSEYGGVM